MKRVSTAEFIRNFGTYSDAALSNPIVVTRNGRDRFVLTSLEQYGKLKHAHDAFEEASTNIRQSLKSARQANPKN